MLNKIKTRIRGQKQWYRIRGKRKELIRKGKPFAHFIHIGKTGGSAIKHVLSKKSFKGQKYVFLHGHDISLANIPKGEKVFFFLRDPITRFTSGYYDRQRKGKPRYCYPWSRGEKRAFERFATPEELAVALSSPDSATRRAAVSAMNNIQHVRDTYRNTLISTHFLKLRWRDILMVGFQENLSKDFTKLKEILQCSQGIELPTDSVNAHRCPVNLNRELSREAILNLKRWYSMDFEIVDFCKSLDSYSVG